MPIEPPESIGFTGGTSCVRPPLRRSLLIFFCGQLNQEIQILMCIQEEGGRKPGSVPPKHRAAMIIHLGQALPTASSDRTRRLSGEQPVSHLDPPPL